MTSRFSARVTVDLGEKNRAVYESINADNMFYPENPTETVMSLSDEVVADIRSDQISHLRANLNSLLRLIQASAKSIESAARPPGGP